MGDDVEDRRTAFRTVAAEYDEGRPDHPDGIYEALEPLAGRCVVDVGAGTGIASRALVARGAMVLAVDTSTEMLGRAVARAPQIPAVVADGARLPLPDASADLVTFGQSWHWLDPAARCAEVHRVLRPGGRWAAWWTHARGAPWMDEYWDLVEAACPGVTRTQRDTDWGIDVRASGLFAVDERISVEWSRSLTIEHVLVDDASRSYLAARPAAERDELLDRLRTLYEREARDGRVEVPAATWLWVGHRLDAG